MQDESLKNASHCMSSDLRVSLLLSSSFQRYDIPYMMNDGWNAAIDMLPSKPNPDLNPAPHGLATPCRIDRKCYSAYSSLKRSRQKYNACTTIQEPYQYKLSGLPRVFQLLDILYKCLLVHQASVLAIPQDTYIAQPQLDETLEYQVHRRVNV